MPEPTTLKLSVNGIFIKTAYIQKIVQDNIASAFLNVSLKAQAKRVHV